MSTLLRHDHEEPPFLHTAGYSLYVIAFSTLRIIEAMPIGHCPSPLFEMFMQFLVPLRLSLAMGCPRNLPYGRGLKVNTAAKALPISAARPDPGRLGYAWAAVLTFCPCPFSIFC